MCQTKPFRLQLRYWQNNQLTNMLKIQLVARLSTNNVSYAMLPSGSEITERSLHHFTARLCVYFFISSAFDLVESYSRDIAGPHCSITNLSRMTSAGISLRAQRRTAQTSPPLVLCCFCYCVQSFCVPTYLARSFPICVI